jgi:hypothetical protein
MSAVRPVDGLPTLGSLVSELAGAAGVIPEAAGEVLLVSELTLDLPVEIELTDEDGEWRIEAAPPTQLVETTVLPVWHRVQLRVSLDDGERSLEPVEA